MSKLKFDTLATERLIIRPYTEADIPAAQAFLTHAETMVFWPRPLTSDAAADWVRKNIERMRETPYGRCALVLKDEDALIGDVGVIRANVAGVECNDLGYIMHRRYWGRGLATEAALALRDYYFDVVRVDSLCANMAWDHHASRRVAEKLGMRRVLEFHNQRNRNILTYLYRVERDTSIRG